MEGYGVTVKATFEGKLTQIWEPTGVYISQLKIRTIIVNDYSVAVDGVLLLLEKTKVF